MKRLTHFATLFLAIHLPSCGADSSSRQSTTIDGSTPSAYQESISELLGNAPSELALDFQNVSDRFAGSRLSFRALDPNKKNALLAAEYNGMTLPEAIAHTNRLLEESEKKREHERAESRRDRALRSFERLRSLREQSLARKHRLELREHRLSRVKEGTSEILARHEQEKEAFGQLWDRYRERVRTDGVDWLYKQEFEE